MNDDERRIDSVLVLMNDVCEERGRDVSHIRFDFSKHQNDHHVQDLLASNQCSIEDFQRTLRQCKTRKFIEHTCMGSEEFGNLALTRLGQARAISAKNGRNRSAELISPVNIGAVHIQGPTQIGNGNTINIQQNLHEEILKIIESSTASEVDKKEAKSLLAKFFENPSVAAVLGSISGTIGNIL
ncbi:MAG: hypothetical protein LBH65_04215 [Desulfovibrio sp.]|jgi:hypothetical protein|nr:hypothetical protein [Desulfovibrio sp.]